MNDFIVMIQTALETKGIKSDYNKIKQMFEKDPAKINAVMDMSATKTEINKFIKEVAPHLQKMFSDLGVKVDLKDIETSMKSVFKETEKASRQQQKEFEKMRKDELRAYIDNEKLKQDATKQRIKIEQDALSLDASKFNTKSNIDAFLARNTKMSKELRAEFLRLKASLDSIDDFKSLSNVNKELGTLKNTAKATGQIGMSMGDNFKEAFGKFSVWVSASAVFFGVQRVIKNMVAEVKNIDSAMISLKKVTDETNATYDRFLTSVSQKAKELGASISDIVNATADFARLGYNLPDAEKLGEVAVLYKNVGDGINIQESSSSIISTMKAFNIEAENSITIIDKFNEVGNRFAISSAGIGEALQKSASGLVAAGNTIDEAIALIVSANNVVQNPETVGQMWKTVSMRIRGAKTELEDAGLEIDGMAESTSKLREELKSLTSFDIMIDDNTFKSTYDIVLGISEVFDKLSDTSRANVLELLAGKRQGNALAAALNNAEDLVKTLEVSQQSSGSAMREQERYQQGIEYSLDRLKASFQELSATTIDSSTIKFFVDFANAAINATTAVGGLMPVIITLGILLPALKTSFGTLNLSLIATQVQAFGLATAFKTLIGTITTFLATNPVGWVLALGTAIFGVKKIYDHFNVTLEEHQEILSQQAQAYDDATAKVKSLEGELESTRLKLEELNAIGGASVVKDGEQTKLEKQTEELQRQLDIAKETQRIAAEEAEKTAVKTLTEGINSEFPDDFRENIHGFGIKGADNKALIQVTRDTELQRAIDKYDELSQKYSELEKKQQDLANSGKGNSKQFSKNADELKYLNTQMTDTKMYANALATALQTESKSITGVTDAGKEQKTIVDNILGLYTDWLDKINNVDGASNNAVETMSNSVETIEEQAKALETQNKAIDEYQKSITSIGKALSDLNKLSPSEIIDLMQEFPDLAKYGYTGSEGIGVLESALRKLASSLYENLDPSIENVKLYKDMYDNAINTSNAIKTLSEALSNMNNSGKLLEDVNTEFKELGYISSETLSKIASQSNNLDKVVTQFNAGLATTDDVLAELTKSYESDFNIYKQFVINKVSLNETFFSDVKKQLPDWVKSLADAYGIDYQNWTTLHKAKLELLKSLATAQDEVNNKIEQGSYGRQGVRDKVELTGSKNAVNNIQSMINEIDKNVDLQLNLSGYTSSKPEKGSKDKKDTKDYIKEAFDLGTKDKKGKWITGKNDLDHQLAMEEITQKQYLDGVEKINKATYGKNKKTHLENYRQYLEEVKKGRGQIAKKLAEDKIKSKFNDLEYEHEMGLKTDDKYWKTRLKYAEKYYKKNGEIIDEYLDEYRSIQSGYYKWTQQQAEETAKKQEKIAENLKDKYTDLIGDITDEIKKEKDDVLDSLEESHKSTIKNLEEQKDSYKDIVKTQLDLLDAKKKQNDYEKSITKQTKEISKIESRRAELEKAAKSGDRTAIAELAKLDEELSSKKEDLLDEQSDHEYDLQKKSLNNALDLNDKLMDAKIDAEKLRFETQKSNIEKLYNKEIELINKAAQYTKEEFGKALDEIATQLASNGIAQSPSYLGSVKSSQSFIADSQINASTSNRSAILSILRNGQGKDYEDKASALAAYTRDNYGAPISKKQGVEVAKLLGVSGINSVSDLTANDVNKNKILEALRKAGFSKGGYVDASMIKRTGEDGLALVKHGEPILTVEQGKIFKELVNNIKPLNNLVKLSTPNISNVTNKTNSPNINITIPIAGNATPSTVSALNNAGNNIVKQIMDEVRKL